MKKRVFITVFLALSIIFSNMIALARTDIQPAGDFERANTSDLFPEAMQKVLLQDDQNIEYVNRLTVKEKMNSLVYSDSNNAVTEFLFSEAVKYINDDGVLCDKTTRLIVQKNCYTNVHNDVRLNFSMNVSNGILLEYNGIEIKVIPEALDVATTSAKLSEMKITSDQRATNRVVYNNAFGQGTKLIYTPAFSGYKEDIIIERYNGCTRYSFIVYSNGLELNGRRLYDESGNDVGGFSDVLVFDANGKKFSGEMEIETLEERKKYRVIYVLPERELENAIYPIDIDPSLVVETFDSNNAKQIIDAQLYTQTGTFFGNATSTIVSLGGIDPIQANGVYGRGVFSFPGLYNDIKFNMFPNQRILSVRLYLYLRNKGTNDVSIKAYPSTTSWSESDTSVRTLSPNYYDGVSDTTTLENENEYTGINITNVAKYWKNGNGNRTNGVMLVCENETNTFNVNFYSTESAVNKPYIRMNYTVVNHFNIVSRYSNRFKNDPDIADPNAVISDAHSFVKFILGTFGKNLNTRSISNATLIPDACSGAYGSSCNDAGCGSNCYASHHRNILRLFDNVYSSQRSSNTIYVEWYNVGRQTMCETRGSTHRGVESIMGGVGWAPDYVDGVSTGGLAGYINSMPIVGVYTLTTIASKKAISAKLILAHEMMHVMGIRDTYNSQPGHKATGSNNQTCIMADFSVKYRNYSTFCTDIEAGRTPPFCAACEKMIEKVIDSRYFPAS